MLCAGIACVCLRCLRVLALCLRCVASLCCLVFMMMIVVLNVRVDVWRRGVEREMRHTRLNGCS